MPRPLLSLGLLVLLLLSACGGSGGTTPVADDPASDPEPTILAGPYHVVQRSAANGTLLSIWGTTFADGFGLADRTLRTNANGVVSGYVDEPPFGYREPDAGLLEFDLPAPADGVACEGGITATGEVAALSTMAEGNIPSIRLLIRRAGTFVGNELDGTYHTVIALQSPSSPTVGGYGEATFSDGMHGVIDWAPFNVDGSVSGAIPPAWPLAHLLAPDGFVRMVHATLGSFDGGVLAGGELCVVGGGHRADGSGAASMTLVFLRKAAGMTQASLSGTYTAVGIDRSPTTGHHRSWSGTLTADGSGGIDFCPHANDEGTPLLSFRLDCSYTVDPDGRLTFSWGGKVFRGGVSASGDYATFGGAIDNGSPPGLFFLIRR